MMIVLIVALGGTTSCKSRLPPPDADGQPKPASARGEGIWKRNVHHHRVVVFVHGLFGDAENTWKCNPRISWAGLLEEDPAIYRDTAIYLASYESPYFHGHSDIKEAAGTLFSELTHDHILDFDEVYIVAHSLGGLVVQQMMMNHKGKVEHVRFVYEFGTPHEGSAVATIGSMFNADPYLNQLSAENRNSLLASMNQEWDHYIRKKHPKKAQIYCGFEGLDTPVAYSGHWIQTRVVDRQSAVNGCGSSKEIPADHITMVKPCDRTAVEYTFLSDRLSGRQQKQHFDTDPQ